MSWNFDDNNKTEAQKQADLERNLKLVGTGAALSSLASAPGRKAAGVALNVLKGVTAAPLGAGYGLLQSAASVLRGKGTGGVFGEVFEKARATTAPADVGGGDTPNIKVKTPANQPNTSGKIIRDTVKSKTPNTTVYGDDLAKKATKGLGEKVTDVKLPDDLKKKIASSKGGSQLKLKFPKVGMLDLVGAVAPFIKMAIDDEKRKRKGIF
tara:strand:+ start:43 stop:672 length:630 start_codon:yes stop_codon:yes gene_type:complete